MTTPSTIFSLIKDLQDIKYWDLGIKGQFRVLQLRQEWDKETCLELRDKIIEALKLQELINELIKKEEATEHSIRCHNFVCHNHCCSKYHEWRLDEILSKLLKESEK